MTEQQATKIILAARWLDHKTPNWQDGQVITNIKHLVDHTLGLAPFEAFATEREGHRRQASAYATTETGYTNDGTIGNTYLAWEIIANAEYARLEATAKERRIRALAAMLKDGEAHYRSRT